MCFCPNAKNKILGLHDAVDVKNFKPKKNNFKIRNFAYVGSFYKGKGIELIYKLAEKYNNIVINFNKERNLGPKS